MAQDVIVVKLDKAQALLAAAKSIGDAKHVADLAKAAEVYAKRQKLSDEVIGHASDLRLDALTLMGRMMEEAPKNKGTRGQPMKPGPGRGKKGKTGGGNNPPPVSPDSTPTQEEQGVPDKDAAKEARALRKLEKHAPDLLKKVKAKTMTLAQARAELKRREKRKKLAEQAAAAPANGDEPHFAVLVGDCLVELEKVEAGSVRLAFADSPYNIGVNYGKGRKADLLPRTAFLDWCGLWMKAVARTLTKDGSFWVLINDESAAEFKLALEAAGLHLRQWLIWYEAFGVNHAGGFNRTHRHLFWAVVNPKKFVFNPDAVNRPSARQAKHKDRRADPGGKTWDSVWGVEARDKDGNVVLPAIPRLTATCDERLPDFPTQLPLALLRAVVGCASEPGDVVLDPFSGSGTTGAASLELGRRYVGIEKNRHYATASEARLKGVKCE